LNNVGDPDDPPPAISLNAFVVSNGTSEYLLFV